MPVTNTCIPQYNDASQLYNTMANCPASHLVPLEQIALTPLFILHDTDAELIGSSTILFIIGTDVYEAVVQQVFPVLLSTVEV